MIKQHVVAMGLATLLAAAGCQGGSGSELSKSQFVRRANDICSAANEKIGALPAPDIADPNATQETITEVIRIQRDAVSDLRALDPPNEDVPAIDEWLESVDTALDQAEVAARALERDQRALLNDANAKGGDAQLQADELARVYGADRCATEEDEPTTST